MSKTSDIEFSPEKLEQVLNSSNLSQSEVNDLAGFKHRNTLNKIIRGKREASATELLRLANVLKVPTETFIKE